MIRALPLLAVFALGTSDAAAHGRDPYATRIHFRAGNDQHVIAGMTIGLVVSTDGGATWRWTCEEALHYADPFDPDYAIGAGGAVLVQSHGGAWIDRGTCSYEHAIATPVVSAVAAGPDGALYISAADASDSAIYKSTDGGASFAAIATPGQPGDTWTSIEVAPADAQRVYLAGFRYTARLDKQQFLFVSRDGGATFDPMSTAGIAVSNSSLIEIAGIGPAADTVYALVRFESDLGGDAIYRSTNAGASWTRIFSSMDPYGLAFLARGSGELVAATRTSGAWRSTDDGMTWMPLPGPPHISTLVERAGEVWAGTQSRLFMQGSLPPVPADGHAIMKSTDLVTWTPVFTLENLGPPACAAGTPVHEECVATKRDLGTAWCCLVVQLGLVSTEVDCTGPNHCGGVDTVVAGDVTVKPPKGCCETGSSPADLGFLLVLALLLRASPRQRR